MMYIFHVRKDKGGSGVTSSVMISWEEDDSFPPFNQTHMSLDL